MDRPLERRAAIRTAVIWEACRASLADRGELTVVDIGGGTGGLAVRIAELGHRVTVVDPSPDALAALDRRATERGVAARVSGRQGDLAGVGQHVEAGAVDLVLCHEVLGLVEDRPAALAIMRDLLAPGGRLSIVVGQRYAAVLARAMSGGFVQAAELLGGDGDGGEHRFTADELAELVVAAGLAIEETRGVRVFSDVVPSTLLDAEPGALEELLALERQASALPELWSMAAQLHLIARV